MKCYELPRDICAKVAKQISDDDLWERPLLDGDAFLAGGYIRSCAQSVSARDVDLFIKGPRAQVRAAAIARDLSDSNSYEIKKSPYAYTVMRGSARPAIQLIYYCYCESAEDLLNYFDFSIACAVMWWERKSYQGICHKMFVPDTKKRVLRFVHPATRNDPLVDLEASFGRAQKFYGQGYTPANSGWES